MDIHAILTQLRQEHAQLTEAIIALERMAAGSGKRPGRPPLWLVAAKQPVKRRGRPPGSRNKGKT